MIKIHKFILSFLLFDKNFCILTRIYYPSFFKLQFKRTVIIQMESKTNLSSQPNSQPNTYMDFIQRLVEEQKQKNPEKYQSAQKMGDYIMTSEYNLKVGGRDKTETILKAEELLRIMKYQGLNESELTSDELELLATYRQLKEISKL